MLDLEAQRRAIGPLMDERIQRVLEHGKFIMGPEVEELEEALAARAGVAHVVTCGNGTDALQLVLMAWGIGPGDAVFVPSFTFTATAEVVSLLGATPVFCDVHEETFNVDAASLEAAIQAVTINGKLNPKAVIPVDLFGLPADYEAIQKIADRHGLRVLADAAQSFGAALGDRPVGSLAEATATSFFPAKPLGCYGDGGAVFTDDEDLAGVLRSLRVHGKGGNKYDTVRVGINSRLDTLQAAVLLAKLTVFDKELASRAKIANSYRDALVRQVCLRLPTAADSAWAQFTLTMKDELDAQKFLGKKLREVGIPTAIYYPMPLHRQPAFSHYEVFVTCGRADAAARSVISLPMHPYLSEIEVNGIVRAVSGALVEMRAD